MTDKSAEEKELEELYAIAKFIDVSKIDDEKTKGQVARFMELALSIVDDSNIFKQQLKLMTKGDEVNAALRKQLAEQTENHIKQYEKAALSMLKVRERSRAIAEEQTERDPHSGQHEV